MAKSKEVRQSMIESAILLLATRGYANTSFNTVLELSKASRGSIYHHFPKGKEELLSLALDTVGKKMVASIREAESDSAYSIAETFFGLWRAHLRNSQLEAGCSVVAVSLAAEERLREKATAIFTAWQIALAKALQKAGLEQGFAEAYAYALISSCEGAVVLSRANKSLAPLDATEKILLIQLAFLTSDKKNKKPLGC